MGIKLNNANFFTAAGKGLQCPQGYCVFTAQNYRKSVFFYILCYFRSNCFKVVNSLFGFAGKRLMCMYAGFSGNGFAVKGLKLQGGLEDCLWSGSSAAASASPKLRPAFRHACFGKKGRRNVKLQESWIRWIFHELRSSSMTVWIDNPGSQIA